MTLSLFILYDTLSGNQEAMEFATAYAKRRHPDLTICFERKYCPRLPKGYDGYILHLSQTTEEGIMNIKESQPWSSIFGISGAISTPSPLTKFTPWVINPFHIGHLDSIIEYTEKIKKRYE